VSAFGGTMTKHSLESFVIASGTGDRETLNIKVTLFDL
jgi:hypothetical protein